MHLLTIKNIVGFSLLGYSIILLVLTAILMDSSLDTQVQPELELELPPIVYSPPPAPSQTPPKKATSTKHRITKAAIEVAHHAFNYDTSEPETKHTRTTPNFSLIKDPAKKKLAFVNFFKPLINEQNAIQRKRREQLDAIRRLVDLNIKLDKRAIKTLSALMATYRIPSELDLKEALSKLDSRINAIPGSLILAQAASESAWGTSRFARKGNNFFGQWCFKQGCGIVPSGRNVDSFHEIATFKSAESSVRAYFKNLNTYKTYKKFRTLRLQYTQKGEPLKGLKLVDGLDKYSERGLEYVDDLKNIILFNKFDELFKE